MLARANPVVKLLCAIGFVLAVVLAPPKSPVHLLWLLIPLALVWPATGAPLRSVLGRVSLALPFALAAFLLAATFQASPPGQPPVWTAEHPFSTTSLLAGTERALRVVLCVTALALLSVCTSAEDFLRALRQLRFPRLLCTILAFTIRYAHTLRDEALRMMRARDSRGPANHGGPRRRAHVAGCLIGALLVRSWERSARVGAAMLSRGFTGELPLRPAGLPRAAEVLGGLLFLAVVGVLACVA
jgi:cobalt/nickel transport system permease protein